jgi:hypothetical protein
MPATIEDGNSRERLIGEVVWEWSEAKYQATRATTPTAPARVCESRLIAFQELAVALETDPTGDRTRAMAIAFRNSSDPETGSVGARHQLHWGLVSSGRSRMKRAVVYTSPDCTSCTLIGLDTAKLRRLLKLEISNE